MYNITYNYNVFNVLIVVESGNYESYNPLPYQTEMRISEAEIGEISYYDALGRYEAERELASQANSRAIIHR